MQWLNYRAWCGIPWLIVRGYRAPPLRGARQGRLFGEQIVKLVPEMLADVIAPRFGDDKRIVRAVPVPAVDTQQGAGGAVEGVTQATPFRGNELAVNREGPGERSPRFAAVCERGSY